MKSSGGSYPCPCCGFLVFQEPPGSYDICPFCFWEDDALQLEFATTLGGGANHPTLEQAQLNFQTLGACEQRCRHVGHQPAVAAVEGHEQVCEDRLPYRGASELFRRPGWHKTNLKKGWTEMAFPPWRAWRARRLI